MTDETRKRKDPARERRRREFEQTLFEYVSACAADPPRGDVDEWRKRLRELGGDLFDQISP